MGRQAGVLAREDAALVSDELPQQSRVLEVERVHGEIHLGFGARWPSFPRGPVPAARAFVRLGMGVKWCLKVDTTTYFLFEMTSWGF